MNLTSEQIEAYLAKVDTSIEELVAKEAEGEMLRLDEEQQLKVLLHNKDALVKWICHKQAAQSVQNTLTIPNNPY